MAATTDTRPLTWQDVINDPSLQDLPYKIELNKRGNIEMSPATNLHGLYQVSIGDLLRDHAPIGRRITECSVETRDGVKVADVAWLSKAFFAQFGNVTPYPQAPEICVEIISPSNTPQAILEKIELYLERGAVEVWTCDLQGSVQYFNNDGSLEQSGLVPGFPNTITLE
jgi:Uma2 family endonuclease